jgi:DNA-binding MarR family transcriptional regulator
VSESLRLKRAEQALRQQLRPLLAEHDIGFEHWQVMAALSETPGLRMRDLAEASVLPPATLTRHVDRLVEQALVVRRIDAEDRRIALVALSKRGEALATRLREAEQRATAGSLVDP